jgi:putative intracellular protease/amidase
MKVAIVLAPRDFRDETLSQLKLFFAKKDVEVKLASTSLKQCSGAHGAVAKPELEIDAMNPLDFDAVLVADGPGVDSMKLFDHRPLLDLVKLFKEANKAVVGIGNGIKVVARANIIKDKRIALADADTKKLIELYRGKPVEEHVVRDGNIITAAGNDFIPELVSAMLAEPSEA